MVRSVNMHHQLISDLYAAVVQPGEDLAVLDKLSRHFQAESAFMFSSHSPVQPEALLLGHNMSGDIIDAFTRRWHEEDPWALAAGRRRLMRRNVVLLSEELVPEHDYLASRYYEEFARRAGIGKMLGSVLFDGSEGDGLPFTNLCWYRRAGQPSFTLDDKRQLVGLLPHLQNAFALRHKLQQATLRTVPGHDIGRDLAIATFMLDPDGRILERNALADTLLRGNPAVVQTLSGRVRGIGMRCAPAFADALAQGKRSRRALKLLAQLADGSLARATLGWMPPDRPTYSGLLAAPAFLLMVEMPPDGREEMVHRAAALFGFTPAERGIVAGLLDGKTVQGIAAERGIAISTVRTQLRAVLVKSGFARQIDLMRALARLAG
jgi:DNA-binding CsgD family transcriptional regulator/PAS domain-containing protein